MLVGERADAFWSAALPLLRRIARLGARNSIVQTVLKLTIPGVPDIYQGCELWDFSMVDPDNRRPVDFAARDAALTEVLGALAGDRGAALARFGETWPDGRLKLAVTVALLALRTDHAALFADGSYEALAASGPEADSICAFRRQAGEDEVVVAVARFPGRREDAASRTGHPCRCRPAAGPPCSAAVGSRAGRRPGRRPLRRDPRRGARDGEVRASGPTYMSVP